MTEKLGQYTTPKADKAGLSDACKGSGEHGLQQDFYNACAAYIKRAKEIGVEYTMGPSGYVSKASAEAWSKGGNPPFLRLINLFGFGLAWEIYEIKLSDAKKNDANAKKLYASQSALLATFGLKNGSIKTNNQYGTSVQIKYLMPESIKIDQSASGVTYGGNKEVGSSVMEAGDPEYASGGSTASASSVAYFFANQFQSIQDTTEAYMLQGERALANDEPLWNSVKKAVNSSLRSCQSGPNGEFIAWYPDYWGMYDNKTPQLVLEDIELIDLKVSQSDSEYYSHVYTPGVMANGTAVDVRLTQGVVSIESDIAARASSASANDGDGVYAVSDSVSAILKEMIHIPAGEEWKYTPKELYRRYGARPNKTASMSSAASLIESGGDGVSDDSNPQYILPFLYALYEFMRHWANQYTATLTTTFMPEIFPGCRIKVKSFDISFYVEEVTHNADYSSGFTTTFKCSCPVGSLVSGMVNPNKG